jgi:hypothetical protein
MKTRLQMICAQYCCIIICAFCFYPQLVYLCFEFVAEIGFCHGDGTRVVITKCGFSFMLLICGWQDMPAGRSETLDKPISLIRITFPEIK